MFIHLTYSQNNEYLRCERDSSLPTGSNLTDIQALNQRAIFNIVRLRGPLSRADIARQTNLSVPTISNITRSLLNKNLIMETDKRMGRQGKPPTNLEANPEAGYAVGLNFDRDRIVGVLVNLQGDALSRVNYDIAEPRADEVIPKLIEAKARLLQLSNISERSLWGVGVSVPGPLHVEARQTKVLDNLFELPGWKDVSLKKTLEEAFHLPVFLENDAIAAAIGETWYGEAQTFNSFFYIFFGLYLGGAAVINGAVHKGVSSFANEFGSIPVQDAAEASGFTPLGSKVSIAALYTYLASRGRPVKSLVECSLRYYQNDPLILEWLEQTADTLAPILATIDCLFDPEAIIFGERFPDPLLSDLIRRLDRRLPHLVVAYKPRHAALRKGWVGDDAAAKGAATLPFYRALNPNVFVTEAIGGNPRGGELLSVL